MSSRSTPPTSSPILFHLGYRLPDDLSTLSQLRETRFVLLCGPSSRAYDICNRLKRGPSPPDLCLTDRYTLLQPMPSVLVAAHGIGTGSVDVLLHELHIALCEGGASDWSLLRVGSCGGLGVAPGTVVVTRRPLNGLFKNELRMFILGEDVHMAASFDEKLSAALHTFGQKRMGEGCVTGDTVCAETFYLAQGRRDGAFCGFDAEQRHRFLRTCQEKGVVNFEMESLAIAAFATEMNVPAAMVCAVLVDRLQDETPTYDHDDLVEFQVRAVQLAIDYIMEQIGVLPSRV
ncbi:unnamed protein product [Choristocarpus tenellus]